jgi:hypothetical protein
MSQSDDECLSLEELNESEQEENAERVAAAEEEYDPSKPDELETAGEAAEADEQEQEADAIELGSQDSAAAADEDSEETDDSIVNDEIEHACQDHDFCVSYALEVDAFLLRTLLATTENAKERQAAIAELLCDHFSKQ